MSIADSINQVNDTLKDLVHELREWKQMMRQVTQEK